MHRLDRAAIQHYNLVAVMWGLTSAALAITGALIRRWLEPPGTLRAILYLIPLIPMVFYVQCVVRGVRHMDELHQRIQLEAVTFAFVCTALGIMLFGTLERAGVIPPSTLGGNWPYIWLAMVLFWVLGYSLAVRRYR